MASITLNSVTFSATPGVNQTVTVKYRLTSDPDVSGSYTTVTTSAVILPNGNFSPSIAISGLANSTSYTVVTTSSCSTYPQAFTTPAPTCVNITNINAVVGA